ncbi:major facilitator superfamily transporter, partial [Pseudomonas amygdali pv. morsprunorum str. M302280]
HRPMHRYDKHFESLLRVFPRPLERHARKRMKARPMSETQQNTPQTPMAVTLTVVSIVMFTFIGYLNIGTPPRRSARLRPQ